MLTLDALVGLSDRRVAAVLSKYRFGALQETTETGQSRYDAIVYGGHKPARCSIWAKEHVVTTTVRVACSCEYFAMNLETVLAVYGNTRAAAGEGILPTKRNPAMKPGLCPHLYLLALHLGKEWTEGSDKKKSKNVNNEVRERDISDLPQDDNKN